MVGDLEAAIPLKLLRLTSSLLPVGAFAYSRGLEHAVHAGWIGNSQQLQTWIFGILEQSFAPLDGALFLRMSEALDEENTEEFNRLDELLLASRESCELQMEDLRTSEALIGLLKDLKAPCVAVDRTVCRTFAGAYALAVKDLEVSCESGLLGLLWSVCEAQVAAALRLNVIGQTDGQRILHQAPNIIQTCAKVARDTPVSAIGNMSFMLAVGSALHETQYSRLFRS